MFYLRLGIRGDTIGLVEGGGGPPCEGEVQGVIVVTRPRGDPVRLNVRSRWAPERVCRGCDPPGGPDSCRDVCRDEFPDWLELTSYPLSSPGGYTLVPEGMELSCAREVTRFTGIGVLVHARGAAREVPLSDLPALLARAPSPPAEAPALPLRPSAMEPSPSGPEPTAKFLAVRLRELGTERPIPSVRITLEENQECVPPKNGVGFGCHPKRPRRLTAKTDASGEARIALPPAALGYSLRPLSVAGFVGAPPEIYPFRRQVPLASWESVGDGQRVTFWLVPPSALRIASPEAAIAASAAHAEMAEWIAKHAGAARGATRVGLYWYVDWEAAAGGTPAAARCVEVDALEGGVLVSGPSRCSPGQAVTGAGP